MSSIETAQNTTAGQLDNTAVGANTSVDNANTSPVASPTPSSATPASSDLYSLASEGSTPIFDAVSFFHSLLGTPREENLLAGTDQDGKMFVKTADGYTVDFTGKSEKWTITSPGGDVTSIFGDPHVTEADGHTWDFTKTSSFIFGNNKVTVETTPVEHGVSFSKNVTVYSGNQRFTVTNIDTDKPRFGGWDDNAKQEDAKLEDGTRYNLTHDANGNERWIAEG